MTTRSPAAPPSLNPRPKGDLPRHVKFARRPSKGLKRGAYKQYAKAGIDWLSLFRRADDGGSSESIMDIADENNINYSTFKTRFSLWKDAGRPTHADGAGIGDGRGCSTREFTEDEESLVPPRKRKR